LIAGVVIVIIVVGIVAGYYLTRPLPLKSTLIIGTTDSTETGLDPAYAYDFFGWEMIQSLSSGLVEYRAGSSGALSDIVPALATSWTNSSNGLVWTFNLRHNVNYTGGQEFNATDVKYSFDRGNIGVNSPDGAFQGIGYAAIVKNVTVVDKYTVRFFLYQPFAAFLALLTVPCTYMVDPLYAPYTHIVNYTAGNPRASTPCALGPYLLVNWTRSGNKDVQMKLTANKNYWGNSSGYPKTQNITINMYADSASLALAISAGDVDIAFRQLTVDQFTSLSANPNVRVTSGPSSFIQYLVFQEKAGFPFNDTQLRIAVASAVNRTLITTTVYAGLAQALYSMIPNGMTFHRDVFAVGGGLNKANFNYSRTQQILEAKGYNAGNKLIVNLWYETSGHYPQTQQLAQALKSSIEKAGNITVNLTGHGLDWSSMGDARRAETMDVFIMGWYPDYVEADDYIQPFYQTAGAGWLHDHYSNPTMDQLVDWSRFNATFAGRDLNYYKIQNQSVVDCPLVPLYQYGQFAVTKPNVYGVVLDVTMNWRNWFLYATA
jgi:peptide/nickel transport system substrate-binding protein